MSIEVILPKWGLTMEVGALTQWFKQEGDAVVQDEAIAEVATEKISNELTAPASGVIRRILVPAGTEDVPVGAVLCLIEPEP